MKTIRHLTLVFAGLCAALLQLAVPCADAADANPPVKMTYQGFLTDQNGVPLGNANPVNTNIFFRIYTAATGGTLKWAEMQTVTIDKGHFSVLLGEGSAEAANSGVFSADLSGVFSGNDVSDRFMEIWLSSTTTATTQIAPRLQFQPAPYAMLAKSARQIVDPNGINVITTAVGMVGINKASPTTALDVVGTITATAFSGSGASLTALNAGQLTTGTVPGARLSGTYGSALTLNNSGNSFSGSGASLTALNASQLTTGTVPDARLSGTYGSALTLNNPGNSFNGATATLTASAAGNKPLIVKGAASQTANLQEWQNSAGTPVASVSSDGKLGIGTTSPGHPLTVDSDGYGIIQKSGTVEAGFWISSGSGSDRANVGTKSSHNLGFETGGSTRMTLTTDGKLGIGTSAPVYPLQVSGGAAKPGTWSNVGYLVGGAGGNTGYTSYADGSPGDVSIYASGRVAATGFMASSDERAKTIVSRNKPVANLEAIRLLRVTDYQWKDSITRGNRVDKGFIAQELETVIPSAVSKSRDFVPSNYLMASEVVAAAEGKEFLVTLPKKHLLERGDRVRLYVDDERVDVAVVRVPEPNIFVFESEKSSIKRVFVWGKEVRDFRTVDFNQVLAAGIGAIQELARRNDELEKKVEGLRKSEARIAELEQKVSRMDALERKLADLEKLVARAGEPRKDGRPAAEAPAAEVKAGASR